MNRPRRKRGQAIPFVLERRPGETEVQALVRTKATLEAEITQLLGEIVTLELTIAAMTRKVQAQDTPLANRNAPSPGEGRQGARGKARR